MTIAGSDLVNELLKHKAENPQEVKIRLTVAKRK